MTSEQPTYKFKLLQEEAVNEDSLEGSIHEKVADQLIEILNSNDSGLTIGIEGAWGSGKSTVVNIFRSKLDERTLFFNFDAWAHEGDPLRRIFLEKLILCSNPDMDNEGLKNLFEKISGRKKIVNVKSKSESSNLGKWLGMSALLVPLGAAILSALDYNKIFSPWSETAGSPSWFFLTGVLFCLLPIIIIFIWSRWGDDVEDEPGKKDWSVIQGSTLENYTQDITEEGERTSVEFENYFNQIIDLLLGCGKYDRVVIVIDNLDRVESKTAKLIWSSLQTFFQHKNSISQIDTSKLWFLIPHDKKGLAYIWSDEDDEKAENVRDSFIEKSIQLNVDIASPVFSSWSKYLEKMIEESLVGWVQDDKNIVARVFKRYEGALGKMPTPRHLRRYVNQVGATGVRWGGVVGIESISLYALLKFEFCNTELQKALLKSDLPNNYKCVSSDSEVKQDLAGMVFGVEPHKGMELLLGGELKSAIWEGNRDVVKTLIDNHPEAIISVCHATLPALLPQSTHTEEYSLNFSRAIVELLIKYQQVLLPEIKAFQNYWIDPFTKWNFDGNDYSSIIEDLYELDPNWDGFERLRDVTFMSSLKRNIDQIGSEDHSVTELKNINAFYWKLNEISYGCKHQRFSTLDESKWKDWLKLTEEMGVSFPFVLPATDTISNLASQMNITDPEDAICNTLISSCDICKKYQGWDEVKVKLTQWLLNPKRSLNNEPAYHLICFLLAKDEDFFSQLSKNISKRECINISQQEAVYRAPSMYAMYAMVFESELQDKAGPDRVKQFWAKEAGDEELLLVTKIIDSVDRNSTIWHLARDNKNQVAIEYIRNNLDNEAFIGISTPSIYIDEYKWADKEFKRDLAARLIDSGSLKGIVNDVISDPYAYRFVVQIFVSTGRDEASELAKEATEKADKEVWSSDFTDGESILTSMVSSVGTASYKDAFVEQCKDLIAGSGDVTGFISQFDHIKEKVIDKDIVFQSLTKDYFQQGQDKLSNEVFVALSDIFAEHVAIIHEADLCLFIDDWLRDKMVSRLDWLSTRLEGRQLKATDSIKDRLLKNPTINCEEDRALIERLMIIFDLKEIEVFETSEKTIID